MRWQTKHLRGHHFSFFYYQGPAHDMTIKKQTNHPNKLNPPFILFPQVYEIAGKHIIHIQVPASSQLHRSAETVFDRSHDGDFRINSPQLIAQIYNQKKAYYTEGEIIPFVQMTDFKAELFQKVRNLIYSRYPKHPWLTLSDKQILLKAGLWKRDFRTGKEGYTLAAVLLFGKEEVIQSVLPHYKIDALVRREQVERYDDRLYIQTNLIDAYDDLMDFVAKHLPDKFYLEGDQRKSLRSLIFREVIANLIVHREYMNASPATFIIYKDKVETRNPNNSNGEGILSIDSFTPFSKNPTIAKFFIQIGRVEELGSGVMNVNRYIHSYSNNGEPQFIEGSIFKTIIPIYFGTIDQALESLISEITNKLPNEAKKTYAPDSKESIY